MADDNKHIDYYNLSAKYFSGEASDAEVDQLEKWVLSSEENKSLFKNFKKAWIGSGIEGNYQSIDVDKEWKSVTVGLFSEAKVVAIETKPRRRLYRNLSIAAAVLVLLVASFWIYQWINEAGYEVVAENKMEEDQLPDGTQVSLNQFSTVRFDDNSKENIRKVELEGDAFFDVERDTSKPFLITTEEVQIEVLGTSFYVDARPELTFIQVSVESGEVAVAAGGQTINLTANETGIYDKASKTLSEQPTEDDNYLAWKTDSLVFENATLDKVVFDLNRRFHAQVSLDNPALAKCELTATYEKQSLTAITTIIERSLGITATVDGNNVIFSGEGCN